MKEIIYKPLNPLWLKAAVMGSVWASVEIVLGSFLHNLRIPMSGTILSFISVYLLVAYHQLWNQKGLIIRAGLICALMKSISPSAIIIGPMTGILAEALLLEITIIVLGQNNLAYFLGGGLAVFSALAHKAISLLIYYGFNFVEMLAKMYQFVSRQIHTDKVGDPLSALVFISLLYFVLGVFAAWLGKRAGMQTRQNTGWVAPIAITFDAGKKLDTSGALSVFKPLLFIVLHLVYVSFVLHLLNTNLHQPAFVLAIIYLVACFIFYKNTLRRLRKIGIWIQFIVITFLAVIVWNVFNHQAILSFDGIFIGIKMVFRAILIMIGFSAIGAELKNPSIKLILYGRGFKNFYHAVDLAFSALPFLISQLAVSQNNKTGFWSLGIRFLNSSKVLLDSFGQKNAKKATVLILTGKVHSGKSTFAHNLVQYLEKMDRQVSGFLTQRKNVENSPFSYQLYDLTTKQKLDFIATQKQEGWVPFRRFYFNPAGFKSGEAMLQDAIQNNAAMVLIDEVGPMELSNNGWSSAIERLCLHPQMMQIWVVREHLLDAVQLKWDIGNVIIADIEKDSIQQLAEKISSILNTNLTD